MLALQELFISKPLLLSFFGLDSRCKCCISNDISWRNSLVNNGKTFLRITNNNSLFFILKSKIIILKHNNILIKPFLCFLFFFFLHLCCYCYLPLMGLVFWNSIHLEVASDSFCFLINSSWLLVFILFMICWKGIYFSYNLLHIGLIFSFHYWCSSCPSRVNWKLMKKEESRVYGKVEDQE